MLVSILSVQFGSAVAWTAFDVAGANGITLLRLAFAGLLLTAIVRPAVRRWSRAQWGRVLLGPDDGRDEPGVLPGHPEMPLGVAVTVEFIGPLLVALAQTRRLVDLLWVVLAGGGRGAARAARAATACR